jgi:hypothetical protein
MSMHPSTHYYLKPTPHQIDMMHKLREAAATYQELLEDLLPDGADKTFCIRNHRTTAMWANVAMTRETDGTPREED